MSRNSFNIFGIWEKRVRHARIRDGRGNTSSTSSSTSTSSLHDIISSSLQTNYACSRYTIITNDTQSLGYQTRISTVPQLPPAHTPPSTRCSRSLEENYASSHAGRASVSPSATIICKHSRKLDLLRRRRSTYDARRWGLSGRIGVNGKDWAERERERWIRLA